MSEGCRVMSVAINTIKNCISKLINNKIVSVELFAVKQYWVKFLQNKEELLLFVKVKLNLKSKILNLLFCCVTNLAIKKKL